MCFPAEKNSSRISLCRWQQEIPFYYKHRTCCIISRNASSTLNFDFWNYIAVNCSYVLIKPMKTHKKSKCCNKPQWNFKKWKLIVLFIFRLTQWIAISKGNGYWKCQVVRGRSLHCGCACTCRTSPFYYKQRKQAIMWLRRHQ